MTVNKTLHNMEHDTDPKQTVLDAVGNLSDSAILLSGMQVLIGTYLRPERTASGLLQAAITRREDEYQGKVGLILKVAPLAFSGEQIAWPNEVAPKVGDWVIYRVHDGFMTTINGHPCRLMESGQIRGIVFNPDMVL